jgi:hypothetical protein
MNGCSSKLSFEIICINDSLIKKEVELNELYRFYQDRWFFFEQKMKYLIEYQYKRCCRVFNIRKTICYQ